MQSVSSRIWTRVAVSISYDDNNYTTGCSIEDLQGAIDDRDEVRKIYRLLAISLT